MYILVLMLVPFFFKFVYKKWKKDNNLMVLHIEKDFDRKYQEYLIKNKVGFYE
jgi:hypothetical protein